jgi:SAM-dependent methyltransferase
MPDDASNGDVTIASYKAGALAYLQQSPPPGAPVRAYLDKVGALVGRGTVLELGSGPGWDAAYLESRGPRVVRTDAVNAFVELLRADCYPARRLDVRVDDFGGPYDAVLANACCCICRVNSSSTCWPEPTRRSPITACSHSPSKRATVKDGAEPSSGCPAISPTGESRPYGALFSPTVGRFSRSSTSQAVTSRGYSF